MSLKDLKSGIIHRNWDVVKSAYENLTGETFPDEPINLAIKESTNLLVKEPVKKRGRPKTETPVSRPQKRKVGQTGFKLHEDTIERNSKPKFVTNLFEDFGDDPVPLTPEEESLLKKMNSNRTVRPNELVQIRCTSCGKDCEVRPVLAAGKSMGSKFKCDKCITG